MSESSGAVGSGLVEGIGVAGTKRLLLSLCGDGTTDTYTYHNRKADIGIRW